MRRGKGKRALAGLLAAALCAGLFFLPASAAPEGAAVWGYSEGLAQCELAGKWGYVDAGRNVVIPLQYDSSRVLPARHRGGQPQRQARGDPAGWAVSHPAGVRHPSPH
ncbi:MAG: hypothetical protein ACLRWQ_04045 [Flavonifractor plautii]